MDKRKLRKRGIYYKIMVMRIVVVCFFPALFCRCCKGVPPPLCGVCLCDVYFAGAVLPGVGFADKKRGRGIGNAGRE